MSGLKLKLHEFHGKLAFAAKLKLYLRSDHVGESGLKFIASLEFPGGPVIDSMLSLWRAWVQSLVRELRSDKPQSVAKRKKYLLLPNIFLKVD